MELNFLERAIELFSPRWAGERYTYRTALTQARAYTAAKAGRRGDGWITAGSSANSEIGPAIGKIRARGRDLVRNNPYAAGYPRMMASKIIGTGIQPRLALTGDDNKPARQRARDLWARFADNCDPEGLTDYYGLQSLACTTVSESGEALIRTIRLPSRAKGAFPLQIVVQEGDYIDTNKNQVLQNGNIVIQGVEYDEFGRRVAYWLFKEHPGAALTTFTRLSPVSERIDAGDVDHVFERLRPGQVRGVSPFASVAMKMRDLDDYDDAALMQKKVAACFAVFVKKSAGAMPSSLAPKQPDSQGRSIETLAPGMIKYLDQGEDVEMAEPPSVDGFTEYHFGQLYAVAAGLGCTFEQLTGNLKGVNLSSIRVGENRFRDLRDHLQWHVYIPQMCRRTWNRVGQVARITGELGISDPWAPRWIPPAWRSPDPQTDVDATRDAVRALQKSPLDAIAESGYDPEEVLAETALFNEVVDKLGIVTDMDPRKVGRTSTPNPQGTGTKEDDKKAAEAA